MKEYSRPEINIMEFSTEDIMTASTLTNSASQIKDKFKMFSFGEIDF